MFRLIAKKTIDIIDFCRKLCWQNVQNTEVNTSVTVNVSSGLTFSTEN